MPRVKFRTTAAGPTGTYLADQTYFVAQNFADDLIEQGYGELAADAPAAPSDEDEQSETPADDGKPKRNRKKAEKAEKPAE